MEIQRILEEMDEASVKTLKDVMSAEGVDLLKGPETGLLMVVAQDPFEIHFFLGEVLVTEAEVRYGDQRGYAMTIGQQDERTILMAGMDAIFKSNNVNLQEWLRGFLDERAQEMNVQKEREKQLIARTKVSFETMVQR